MQYDFTQNINTNRYCDLCHGTLVTETDPLRLHPNGVGINYLLEDGVGFNYLGKKLAGGLPPPCTPLKGLRRGYYENIESSFI